MATKPEKYTASKVATAVPALEKRVDQLVRQAEGDREELLRRDIWIQLCITALLSLMRFAYAICHSQGDVKRVENFKRLGKALNEALEQIEPEF